MNLSLEQRFGTAKPVIAMLHFPGLPGRPRHNRELGRTHLVDVVGRDLESLQAAGVDGVLFCNENDIPYQLAVGPEIPAAMAAVIGELRASVRVPFRGEHPLGCQSEHRRGARNRCDIRSRGVHRCVRERPRDDRARDR